MQNLQYVNYETICFYIIISNHLKRIEIFIKFI